jgi:hypothetical protein
MTTFSLARILARASGLIFIPALLKGADVELVALALI